MIHFSAEERSKLRELLVSLAEDCPNPVDRTARKGERDRPATDDFWHEVTPDAISSVDAERQRQNGRSALPDPYVVRKLIRQRVKSREMFGHDLVANPVWDMLLDLLAAYCDGKQISVTSLCIASGVPQTTALSWINRMMVAGMIVRTEDQSDRRRAFIRLSRPTLHQLMELLDLPLAEQERSATISQIGATARKHAEGRSAA